MRDRVVAVPSLRERVQEIEPRLQVVGLHAEIPPPDAGFAYNSRMGLSLKAGARPLEVALLLVIFAVSYEQAPLFSSNQNTYLLHGLAQSGSGLLSQDWLARTTDPVPVFSALVGLTARAFGENAFYVYYALIVAIYAYSLLGIASFLLGTDSARLKSLCFFVLIAAMHSGLLSSRLSALGLNGVASILAPDGPMTSGLAGQYVLGPVFQPSVFGTFLLLSIHQFLRDRPLAAVVCLATAGTLHPTYLLCAAVLTGTYMAILLREQRTSRQAIRIGAFTLVLVGPVLAYSALRFGPTTAEIANRAREILIDYRMPHHARPDSWFRGYAPLQVTLVVSSLYLVRRTRLFPVLLPSFVVAEVLTMVEVVTGNKGLALLFPWRASVFLVPIASTILVAGVVHVLFRTWGKPISKHATALRCLALIALGLVGYRGARSAVALLGAPRVGLTPAVEFVARTSRPGDLYLIPPEMDSFRLAAGVPVFIDLKSHPYKDAELVEWFERIRVATDFYAADSETKCTMLGTMATDYGITHVVLENPASLDHCDAVRESYRDGELGIYAWTDR